MINVTAAIIERDGKVLLAKRSSTGSLPNKWEFPGGKVEAGETPEACLSRELWEEFEIEAVVGAFIAESIYNYDHGSVRLMAYQVYTDADIITMNAHDDIEWVPKGHLLDYELAPADVPIAKRISISKRIIEDSQP